MTVLTAHQFDTLMQSFDLNGIRHIAVGVSGGADSLCLTLFLADWAAQHHIALTALTVNHNLRAVAAEEANQVHDFLTKKNIHHCILTNTQPIPATGLEEYARQVRYHLLTDYCQKNAIHALFLAHHAGDQAETFLLRLSKKSGLTGLKAMTPETTLNGLRILRPFLTLPKQLLTDTLTAHGINWAEDEMNQNLAYTRVKWRQFLPVLHQSGITEEAIETVTRRLARADSALSFYVNHFIQKNVWLDFRGFARLSMAAFQTVPDEIKVRILQTLLQTIGQARKPVSLKSVEDLCPLLPCPATLGECVLVPHRTGLYIAKEARYMPPEQIIEPHMPTKWDRFLITAQKQCVIRAGTPENKIENIPVSVQKTFPAVFMQKELEKEIQIDYKEKNDPFVQIQFITLSEGYRQE